MKLGVRFEKVGERRANDDVALLAANRRGWAAHVIAILLRVVQLRLTSFEMYIEDYIIYLHTCILGLFPGLQKCKSSRFVVTMVKLLACVLSVVHEPR